VDGQCVEICGNGVSTELTGDRALLQQQLEDERIN